MALSGTKRNLYGDLLLNRQRREVRVLVLCEGHDDSLVESLAKCLQKSQALHNISRTSTRPNSLDDMGRCSLLISRLIPNKTPQKLEVLTSVF